MKHGAEKFPTSSRSVDQAAVLWRKTVGRTSVSPYNLYHFIITINFPTRSKRSKQGRLLLYRAPSQSWWLLRFHGGIEQALTAVPRRRWRNGIHRQVSARCSSPAYKLPKWRWSHFYRWNDRKGSTTKLISRRKTLITTGTRPWCRYTLLGIDGLASDFI